MSIEDFNERERAIIRDLAKRLHISEHKVLVQGLRAYQLIVIGTHRLEPTDKELGRRDGDWLQHHLHAKPSPNCHLCGRS